MSKFVRAEFCFVLSGRFFPPDSRWLAGKVGQELTAMSLKFNLIKSNRTTDGMGHPSPVGCATARIILYSLQYLPISFSISASSYSNLWAATRFQITLRAALFSTLSSNINKGTWSRDRIQIFGQKWTVLLINKCLSWFFKFSICSSYEMQSMSFPTRFRWKHIGEPTFIGDIYHWISLRSSLFPIDPLF